MTHTGRLAFAACSLLLLAVPAFADAGPGDTIIVTATRTEMPLERAIVPVTVITREEIELSLATDLAELLRFEAGIDVSRNGGPGQATSIFLRGTESNHTLVLVDGVRINPGTIGGAAFQHIAPEMIERVEIVEGARSALFGTEAIGGVINIITRRAEAGYLESSLGAGSFDTRSGFISGGNRGNAGEFGVTLNFQESGGFAPRIDSDIERGYDNLSANAYGARRLGAGEISLRHWQATGNVEYLDFFLSPVDQDFRNAATALGWTAKLGSSGSSKLVVSYMEDEITQNQVEDFVESERVSVDWQYSHGFDAHTLTAGLYAVDETAATLSFGSGFEEDTAIRAAFVQDEWSKGRHRTFAAMRLSDHETFGNRVTWNAEYALEINAAWTFNAGLGHAFRAPDATDRYGFGGSPDLNPELADEVQLSLRYAPASRHSLRIELFSNNIEDLIEFNNDTFVLENIDAAEIRGVELGYEYRGDAWNLNAGLVRQRADNVTADRRLWRRAEQTANVSVVRNIGRHRLGLAVFASGDREEFGGIALPGYVLANLTGQVHISEDWSLNARIENLLDTKYETAANFRMQERSGFVELKYHWR